MEEKDCEIVGEVERTPLKSPVKKKLKQSRLPFARLDSKTPQKISSLSTQKKRKLSGSGVSGSCAKTVGSEVKLDAPASKKKQKTQKKIGKRQIRLKVNQKNADKAERKRKRGGPSSKEKRSHVLENNEKLSKSSHQLMSDDEVSSSVDDEVEAPKAKKKPIENTRKLLPLLLCKEPTQQAEISTSTEELSDKEEKENLEDVSEGKKISFDEYMAKNHESVNNSENESEEIEINGRKEEENVAKEADRNKCNDYSKNNKVTEVNVIKRAVKKKATAGVDGVGKKFENKPKLNNRQVKENAGKGVKKTTFCNDSKNSGVVEENDADAEEVKKTSAKPSASIGKNSSKEDGSETLNEICSTVENEYMEMDGTEKGESIENIEEIKELTQKTETEVDNTAQDDRPEVKDQKQIEREECELELNENDMEKNKEMKEEKEQIVVDMEPKILEKVGEEVKERKEVENNTQEQEEAFKKENLGGSEKKDSMIESNKTIGQEQKLKTIEDGKTKDSGDKDEILSEGKKENIFDVKGKKVKEVKEKITNYLNVVKKPTKDGDEIGNVIKKFNKERCPDVGEKENKLLEQEEKMVESTVNEGSEMICEKEKESVNISGKNEEANGKKNEADGMDTDIDKESERMLNSGSLNSKISMPSPKGTLLSGSKTVTHVKPKRITAKHMEGERKKQLVEVRENLKHERQKKKQEILAEKKRLRKEKEEERQKQREEKEKIKEDMKRKRQEELDAKRQKKEEDLQRKEEEKKLKEEEKRQKDEEKRQKEEARKQAEEEKQRQKDKLKKKFASFFVAKKHDYTEMEEESDNGLFKQFRVKEDMQMAPRNRTHLSEYQRLELDGYISDRHVTSSELYLEILKAGNYVKQKSECTWPPEDKKEDMDDIEIIEEDEDLGGMDGMIEDTAAGIIKGRHLKAKFLCFCENRRPAYRGTWSKSSSSVSSRRPFAKHDTFDYEYDSDDDWEEEEAGESLSDSEGEEKEEEEGDQYEVDNDFFVPHGYLSDDEGRSDEEDAADENLPQDDNTKHKEKLKQKQAEFEEEMKKKTKQLKPRIMGCLWMADANNNPAYSQLLKILNPHKVVNLCSQLPIGTRHGGLQPVESKDRKLEEEGVVEDKNSVKQKFVKTFPEEAVPALIQLLHGNRHGKAFLSREFSDYWRKRGDMEGNCFLAKRKVELKIQELGRWRKCPDEGPFHKVMMWYVSKEVREEYGLAELSQPNTWNYINKPKERREVNFDDNDDAEDGSKASKTGKLIPITAFAKKMTQTPVSSATSPTSSTNATPQQDETPKAETGSGSGALSAASPPSVTDVSPSSSSITKSSRKSVSTPGQQKKKVALLSVPRGQEITGAQRASFASFFKKTGEASSPRSSVDFEKEEHTEINDKEEVECITLE